MLKQKHSFDSCSRLGPETRNPSPKPEPSRDKTRRDETLLTGKISVAKKFFCLFWTISKFLFLTNSVLWVECSGQYHQWRLLVNVEDPQEIRVMTNVVS